MREEFFSFVAFVLLILVAVFVKSLVDEHGQHCRTVPRIEVTRDTVGDTVFVQTRRLTFCRADSLPAQP